MANFLVLVPLIIKGAAAAFVDELKKSRMSLACFSADCPNFSAQMSFKRRVKPPELSTMQLEFDLPRAAFTGLWLPPVELMSGLRCRESPSVVT